MKTNHYLCYIKSSLTYLSLMCTVLVITSCGSLQALNQTLKWQSQMEKESNTLTKSTIIITNGNEYEIIQSLPKINNSTTIQ